MPLNASARSDSIAMRRPRPYPVCRRRSSFVTASKSIVSPAGTPSRIATSALPCDSPAVRKRNIRGSFYPKFLPHPAQRESISRVNRAGRDLALSMSSTKEDAMRLVADRFVEDDDGRVMDLSTGERVVLTIDAAGNMSAQRRWAVRCDALQKLHHRRIVPLVDFGAIGTSRRFEAWRCGSLWAGAREEAQKTSDLVRRFFLASGLTTGSDAVDRVRAGPNGAAMLPDESAGYPCEIETGS